MSQALKRKNTWNICKSRSDKDHTLTNPPPRSVVISVFAIIILSTIGAMFASGNHTVMGSAEDPKDGKSVATAVFGAVIIYGVSSCRKKHPLEAGSKLRSDEPKLIARLSSPNRSSSSSAAARHYSTRDRQQAARSRCGRRFKVSISRAEDRFWQSKQA
jgi:hypothetical protein